MSVVEGSQRLLATGSINAQKAGDDTPENRLEFAAVGRERRLTHQLFRFPAKFHPPVIRQLLNDWTLPGHLVCDPFAGSGTLLVEAAVAGRSAVGWDVDPLSVFLSNTKAATINPDEYGSAADALITALDPLRRDADAYKRFMFTDLSKRAFSQELGKLEPPAIPNLEHWFRRYVVVDLLRIRSTIHEMRVAEPVRSMLLLIFASSIRASSNADPVPVSGLERTKHMLQRDAAGRLVDPFMLFEKRLRQSVLDVGQFAAARDPRAAISATQVDVSDVLPATPDQVDAVITSPPYHGAVDYYRRHQLEMFWLGLTRSQTDRLALLDQYIGRAVVPAKNRLLRAETLTDFPLAAATEGRIRHVSPKRADAFRHYAVAMRRTLANLAAKLKPGSPAIFVVGHSVWNGTDLDTSALFEELGHEYFTLELRQWYPVQNRHMSYGRHNGANIDREHVLIFRRRD